MLCNVSGAKDEKGNPSPMTQLGLNPNDQYHVILMWGKMDNVLRYKGIYIYKSLYYDIQDMHMSINQTECAIY